MVFFTEYHLLLGTTSRGASSNSKKTTRIVSTFVIPCRLELAHVLKKYDRILAQFPHCIIAHSIIAHCIITHCIIAHCNAQRALS
jgi:hypothetical protein